MAATQILPYHRVYVWELPVRAFHWINAIAITLLALTGLMIGSPQTLWMSQEPSQQYWFGWVRFTHFAAAYVFFFNILFRIYWGFVGNAYSRWDNYIPYKMDQLRNIWEVVTVDVFQLKLQRKLFIGHNFMAGLSYFLLLLVCLFQVATGFALYSSMSDAYLPHFFGWVVPLFGGDAQVRQWHHTAMWLFVIFTIVHLYLVAYHDVFEGRGTTSSIIGGWTFMKDDELKRK
jgi:Ni/Fe-hydrogenase 1 B-type cytochrome subunit